MANGSGGGGGIGLGGVIQAFGGSRAAPKPKYLQFARGALAPATGVAKDVLRNIRSELPSFYQGFEEGTGRQLGLQGEQEAVLRNLLQRRLGSDPQQQLRETGNTLFSFIDPNVINPLARFDVNQNMIARRARGLNPSAFDSTAERLRNARIASGRYYDVARDVYGRLPQVYQQIRDAGVTDEMLAAGIIPQIQRGYRDIDMAPLIPLRAGLDLAGGGADLTRRIADAERAAVYGYHQPTNIWDRAGDASRAVSNTLAQASDIYSSLYGGGIGGIGGMFGGGGGAPAAAAAPGVNRYPYFQQPGFGGYAAPVL